MSTCNMLPPILTAPREIMFKVTDYIGRDDLLILRLVCKHWDAMVCSIVFKTLTLKNDSGYNVTPWQSLIENLENPLHPSRSIGAFVQDIHIQTNCVTTDELFQLAQKCLYAKTMEIPFRTLQQLNKWLHGDAGVAKKKKRSKRRQENDLPAAPDLLQLFDRLFLETSLTTLSLPNTMNGAIFKTGILNHLAGLHHLNLGHGTHPPFLDCAFDLDLLTSLHDSCPQLESLTCGLSSAVGSKMDLKHIKEYPPFVWDKLEQLDIHVLGSPSSEDTFNGLEHTKMLAYLAATMPRLTSLAYVCCGQGETCSMTVQQQLDKHEEQLGPMRNWSNCFRSLAELRLCGWEFNIFAAHIVFVRSITSLHIEDCTVVALKPSDNRAAASWWLCQLALIPKLLSLYLAPPRPADWDTMNDFHVYICVQEILDTLPDLQTLKLENIILGWLSPGRDYLSTSALISMLVGSVDTCGPAHPLTSLALCSVMCLDTTLFEYISARCPQFDSLSLRATPMIKSSLPTTLHALSPSCNDGISLHERLNTLAEVSNNNHSIWLPMIHSTLSSLTIGHGRHRDQVRSLHFRRSFDMFGLCVAPSFAGSPNHSFTGYFMDSHEQPRRRDFSMFLHKGWHRRYCLVLCKSMKSDPFIYRHSLPC
ncbi:hypothetical protein DM01DRAFT_1216743 [Hesseltinella vesiculosa]|uniref:F-box domain-containing protein n=1 Tax=Hesseltinella vesiculosa TaxID=101127 RepID=A0A1X2GNG4_9FUNG|nr:hypothetical protein DM01DRAFT_1216743 [Hesseltinella vesiculosa]